MRDQSLTINLQGDSYSSVCKHYTDASEPSCIGVPDEPGCTEHNLLGTLKVLKVFAIFSIHLSTESGSGNASARACVCDRERGRGK